ncbi:MAG: 2-keto-4-pentenoate hydratase [Frankiales bacterium]|nr:2-keto-4-pentenoate hydratase [Frankiales bacterium]
MRLTTIRSGGRDGTLALVDRSFSRMLAVAEIAPTLQAALDDWATVEGPLRTADERLHADPSVGTPYDGARLAAPLPRTYQFLDAGIYLRHMWAIRAARGDDLPADAYQTPLMYQGPGDPLLAATDPIRLPAGEDWGVDIEAEVGVLTGDVPMGTSAARAGRHIRLLVLLNDVSLRAVAPKEVARGFGFLHGKPASSLSPVAVTPDEFGAAWDGSLLHGRYVVSVRGARLGDLDPGEDTSFTFADLLAHAARTRDLRAGTLVGAGALASVDPGTRGYGCIAEARAYEQLETGSPRTPFLQAGESCRLEMLDASGASLFGAIQQTVEAV